MVSRRIFLRALSTLPLFTKGAPAASNSVQAYAGMMVALELFLKRDCGADWKEYQKRSKLVEGRCPDAPAGRSADCGEAVAKSAEGERMRLVIWLCLAAAPLAAQAHYDLLLKGGHVIDPKNGIDAVRDVGIRDGRIAAMQENVPSSLATRTVGAAGLYVTPGLVDIHVHVYAGTGVPHVYYGDNCRAVTMACSRAPEPRTRIRTRTGYRAGERAARRIAAEEILCGCGVSRHFCAACCNCPSAVDPDAVFPMRHILTVQLAQEYRHDHRVNDDIGRGA